MHRKPPTPKPISVYTPNNNNNNRHATTILSWVPHQRQFAALCAVATLPPPLLQLLLSPTPPPATPPPSLPSLLPAPLAAELCRRFNSSQQRALAAVAASVKGTSAAARVVLVQGPPGTGKTAAICGMLTTLLIRNASATIARVQAVTDRVQQLVRGWLYRNDCQCICCVCVCVHVPGIVRVVRCNTGGIVQHAAARYSGAGCRTVQCRGGRAGCAPCCTGYGHLHSSAGCRVHTATYACCWPAAFKLPPLPHAITHYSSPEWQFPLYFPPRFSSPPTFQPPLLHLPSSGVLTGQGQGRPVRMVRVGVAGSILPEVRAYHIDSLADMLAQGSGSLDAAVGRRHKLLQECGAPTGKCRSTHAGNPPQNRLRDVQQALAAEGDGKTRGEQPPAGPGPSSKNPPQTEKNNDAARAHPSRAALRARVQQLKQQLQEARSAQRAQVQARRLAVLRWAEVVVGTLVSVGSALGEAQRGRRPGQEGVPAFDAVVADEAAQVLFAQKHCPVWVCMD